MKLRTTSLTLLLIILFGLQPVRAQNLSQTFRETREWLLKMDRSSGNTALRQLFEEADVRMTDLIQALDDPQQNVSINAQVIINYLGETAGLKALDEWYRKAKEGRRNYSMPKMKLKSEAEYLEGNDSDLAKLVLKNKALFEAARFNEADVSAKVIAHNKRVKAALIEIVQGQIFTAGWHAVIKQEGDKWRLISDNNIWMS